jgi:hypothetical protein
LLLLEVVIVVVLGGVGVWWWHGCDAVAVSTQSKTTPHVAFSSKRGGGVVCGWGPLVAVIVVPVTCKYDLVK